MTSLSTATNPGETSALTVRRAVPADASRIDALKRACFPAAYLDLSVFRSPKAVGYLAALVSPGLAHRHPILVAERADGTFEGYVQAVTRDETIHLNYIGVDPGAGGRGLGNRLLAAFHELGREAGCTRATLDVFASNGAVLDWYRRNGYAETSRSETAIVDLTRIEPRPAGLVYLDLDPARREEAGRGFAMVEAEGGSLGIIAGDTVRPRFEDPALDAATLAGAMRADLPERTRMIVSVDPGDLPTLDRQTSLRLERSL